MAASDLGDDEAVPDDALVLRFSPVSAEAVLDRARDTDEVTGTPDDRRVFSSVWVSREVATTGEEAAVTRLLGIAQLYMDPVRNRYYYVCTAGVLREAGFALKKDRYPDEESEHYSVDLGVTASEDTAQRFLDLFTRHASEGMWPA